MKGEIEAAKEAYHTLEVAETAVHKTKKTYEAAHHEHAALQYDLTALQSSGVAGKIDKVRLFLLERKCSIDICVIYLSEKCYVAMKFIITMSCKLEIGNFDI